MIILAIDPALAASGWAILDLSGRRPRCLSVGTYRTTTDYEDRERLTQLAGLTFMLLADGKHYAAPTVLVIEDQTNLQHAHGTRGKTNARAHLCRDVQHRISGVAEARGVRVVTIAPRTWRARLKLSKATDAGLKRAVYLLCDGVPKTLSIHAAEAILVGIAGARELRAPKRRGEAA